MHEDEGLGRLIRTRNYSNLVNEIDREIKKHGWIRVNENLRELRGKTFPSYFAEWKKQNVDIIDWLHSENENAFPEEVFYRKPEWVANPHFSWAIRSGTFRDALAVILDVPIGLDIDHLESTGTLESKSLEELREHTLSVASRAFDDQIRSNNTFFIDIESLTMTPFVSKVPDIIESRKNEIESLPKKPKVRDFVKTYYGFEMLTLGSIRSTEIGVDTAALDIASDFLDELGISKPEGVRLKYDRTQFSQCLDSTAQLLVHIIEMSTGGRATQLYGAEQLGFIGDSRATKYLIANLESEKEEDENTSRTRYRRRGKISLAKEKKILLYALESIGDPAAYDTILRIYQNEKSSQVIKALSGIYHPQTTNKLLEIAREGKAKQVNAVLGVLWRTRDSEALEILREKLRVKGASTGREIIRSLILMGKRGHQILRDEIQYVAKALKTKSSPWIIIEMLKGVEGIFENEDVIESIAEHIENSKKFRKTRQSIDDIGQLPDNSRMLTAYARLIDSGASLREILPYMKSIANDSEQISNALVERTDDILRMAEYPSRSNAIALVSLVRFDCFFEQDRVKEFLIQLVLNDEKWKRYETRPNRKPLLGYLMERRETALDSRLTILISSYLIEGESSIFEAFQKFPELLEVDEIYSACLNWTEKVSWSLDTFRKIREIPKLMKDKLFMQHYIPQLLKSAKSWPSHLAKEVNYNPAILEIKELRTLFDSYVEEQRILNCPFCDKLVGDFRREKTSVYCTYCDKYFKIINES